MRLRFFVVTAALLSASLAARADSYTTFDLASTYNGGGTIDGTFTLDTTTHTFTQVDLTLSGFPSADDGTLTDIEDQQSLVSAPYSSYGVFMAGDGESEFSFFIPTDTLAGYTGGSICTISTDCVDPTQFDTLSVGYQATSGSLTEVATTPEPASLLLLGTGLLGFAGVVRRRFV